MDREERDRDLVFIVAIGHEALQAIVHTIELCIMQYHAGLFRFHAEERIE